MAQIEVLKFEDEHTPFNVRRHVYASLIMFVMAIGGIAATAYIADGSIRLYGIITITYLAAKLILSAIYKPAMDRVGVSFLKTALVIPAYNEDPVAFTQCLQSIANQTHLPDEVWITDDGSDSLECLDIANQFEFPNSVAKHVVRQHNQGKRFAQKPAFQNSDANIFITVDSDTALDKNAIKEGLKPFKNANIKAVTGRVRALNPFSNVLTRLIDLRYANAFLYERAAYSVVGTVLCCCGSLSFYRSTVIKDNLDDFLEQQFLGVPVQYGDDRRLTNYALQQGDVVFQSTSVAFTAVPEKMSHWLRQQLRWNKSFFRETLWVMRSFKPWTWAWFLSTMELTLWIAMSLALGYATFAYTSQIGQIALWFYAANAAFMAYARSVKYFGDDDTSLLRRIAVFALSPLYAVIHVFVLIPLRVVAIFSLKKGQWGTRGKGVEVGV